jgi:integral membrane protein (TIGR00529 family)
MFSIAVQRGSIILGFVDPLTAIVISLIFLVVFLYKRIDLGIILNATALLLAFLALDWQTIPSVIYATTDPYTGDGFLAISVVSATFVIMLLSQLYSETGMINNLSESLGRIINNPKAVLSIIPAVIGLIPVAGGALMSAPIVGIEAEKLKLKPDRKAFVNVWFRHTIFPVYPTSLPIIITAGLTSVAIPLIILRQIPVVLVMVIVGYIIGFWKISNVKSNQKTSIKDRKDSIFKNFLKAFSPVLATIIAVVLLDTFGANYRLSQQGLDVLIAALVGVIVLIAVSKPDFRVFTKPFKSWAIYGTTLAAYGALLLRKIMVEAGISSIFSPLVTNGNIDIFLLLIIAPAVFGVLTGSATGGIAISIPILYGLIPFTPNVAAMIYISAYLGYVIAPTHLCFTFTADYFKCSLGKMYRYIIPSFLVTFAMALLVYFLF